MRKKTEHKEDPKLFKLTKDSPFVLTEAYKAVRTNLLFSLAINDGKTFIITSSNAREGKSTTSANIAIALAQTSVKVLLIDADLRKPMQHKIFSLDNSHGLSTFLVGLEPLSKSMHVNVEPNLDIITSGPLPPNPSELLGGKNMGLLISKLEEHYDYIIIDTPPINLVTDALALSEKTAGVVLVAKFKSTKYDELKRVVDAVQFGSSRVIGIVLTEVEHETGRYGRYYSRRYGRYGYYKYGYGYGDNSKKRLKSEAVKEEAKVEIDLPPKEEIKTEENSD